MSEEGRLEVDWVHPPSHVEEVSLWPALHDARLLSIELDAMACTARATFEHIYLMKANELPEDTRIIFDFAGVKALRAERADPWPGEFEEILDEPNDQRLKRIEAYQQKFITQSIDFASFSKEILEAGRREFAFWVLEPNLIKSDDTVAVRFMGFEEERYTQWSLQAKTLSISLSNGVERTLEELLDMGEIFWGHDDV